MGLFKNFFKGLVLFCIKIGNISAILFFVGISTTLLGQTYTSYITGNINDTLTQPSGGICLMGGATENDQAMRWFLKNAQGGDILVLRTSGSNGYNNYLFTSLNVKVNSVETIVCNSPEASTNSYVLQKIKQAEGIWFAGGDQWDYISYWRNSPVDSLINQALWNRKITIGGTSAGMAILGGFYFTARNGTITSPAALADPFNKKNTIDSDLFINCQLLSQIITDTHFDNPDRRGRLVSFLARIATDFGILAKAIACDEYTSVCIDSLGRAQVYGNYPEDNDNAYFIQVNCEIPDNFPENCSPGIPLTWNKNQRALNVCEIKGTPQGTNTFNITDWTTDENVTWLDWSVNGGTFIEKPGEQIDCNPLSILRTDKTQSIQVYPNPATGSINFQIFGNDLFNSRVEVYTLQGQLKLSEEIHYHTFRWNMDISQFEAGMYLIRVCLTDAEIYQLKWLKE